MISIEPSFLRTDMIRCALCQNAPCEKVKPAGLLLQGSIAQIQSEATAANQEKTGNSRTTAINAF